MPNCRSSVKACAKSLRAAVVAGLQNAGGGIGAHREPGAGQQPGFFDKRRGAGKYCRHSTAKLSEPRIEVGGGEGRLVNVRDGDFVGCVAVRAPAGGLQQRGVALVQRIERPGHDDAGQHSARPNASGGINRGPGLLTARDDVACVGQRSRFDAHAFIRIEREIDPATDHRLCQGAQDDELGDSLLSSARRVFLCSWTVDSQD